MLHFIPYTIFVTNYINAFLMEYQNETHIIYVYGSHEGQEDRNIIIHNSQNVIVDKNVDEELFMSCFARCDILLMQYIPENSKVCRMLKEALEKSSTPLIIVPWGRELFDASDIYHTKEDSLVDEICTYKKYFIKRCSYILTSQYGFNFVVNNYETNCKNKYFNLLNTFSIDECSWLNEAKKTDTDISIMIGHRGTWSSRHIPVLKRLHTILGGEVKVICPLVYGNSDCIKEVVQVGNELFNDKYICIQNWQEKQEYYRYLNDNVDVAIFNNESSEGANTIFFLVYAGKKVFVSKENEVYWILKDLGVVFGEYTEDISKEEIQQVLTVNEKEKNKKIMEQFGSVENLRKNYSSIFNVLLTEREYI